MKTYTITGTMIFRFTTRITVDDPECIGDAAADAVAAGDYEITDYVDHELDFEGAEPVDDYDGRDDTNSHVHPIMREVLPW